MEKENLSFSLLFNEICPSGTQAGLISEDSFLRKPMHESFDRSFPLFRHDKCLNNLMVSRWLIAKLNVQSLCVEA